MDEGRLTGKAVKEGNELGTNLSQEKYSRYVMLILIIQKPGKGNYICQ